MREAFLKHIPMDQRIAMIKLFLSEDHVSLLRWAMKTTVATQNNLGTEELRALLKLW